MVFQDGKPLPNLSVLDNVRVLLVHRMGGYVSHE
jgi:hypothetical protein